MPLEIENVSRCGEMAREIEKNMTTVEKLLPFKSLFFACKRKLSKTSRLLRLAATGNCPEGDSRRRRDVFESLRLQAKKRLLKGNNFSTITMTESENNIHAVNMTAVLY